MRAYIVIATEAGKSRDGARLIATLPGVDRRLRVSGGRPLLLAPGLLDASAVCWRGLGRSTL